MGDEEHKREILHYPLTTLLSQFRVKHNFLRLEIWKRSRAFVSIIYKKTSSFPVDERYSLTSQIRRAAISIPSNIAEGCERNSNKYLSRFLDMSMGSCCEVETQIYIANNLEYFTEQTCTQLTEEITEIRKMINGFKSTLF